MITLAVLGFAGTTIARRSDGELHPPVPVRGAAETFAQLRRRGVKVALITDLPHETAEELLGELGWTVGDDSGRRVGAVDALVCADEVAAGRPAPYLVHRAMERTGIRDVRQVLVAGDTLAALETGRASGARFVIGVLTGAARREELAAGPHDAILANVTELIALAVPAAPLRT